MRNIIFDEAKWPMERRYYTVDEAVSKGHVFMNRYNIEDRRVLGEDILAPTDATMRGIWGNNESEANENPGERDYDDWIGALAIALLEPAEVRKKMDGVEDEDKDAQYKNSIHAFLWEYQETHKSDREFVDVMHSFSTLNRMLRKPDERDQGVHRNTDR
jgi:hypothetical protein